MAREHHAHYFTTQYDRIVFDKRTHLAASCATPFNRNDDTAIKDCKIRPCDTTVHCAGGRGNKGCDTTVHCAGGRGG